MNRYFLASNIIGIAAFLYFSSWTWAPAGEEGLVGGPGDALVWMLSALPIWLLCCGVNLIWLICLLRLHRDKWRSARWLAVIFVLWLAAIAYDRSRGFTGQDLYLAQASADKT
jgi:hypothetical protein